MPGPVCKRVGLTVFLLWSQESDVKTAQEDRRGASFETPHPRRQLWGTSCPFGTVDLNTLAGGPKDSYLPVKCFAQRRAKFYRFLSAAVLLRVESGWHGWALDRPSSLPWVFFVFISSLSREGRVKTSPKYKKRGEKCGPWPWDRLWKSYLLERRCTVGGPWEFLFYCPSLQTRFLCCVPTSRSHDFSAYSLGPLRHSINILPIEGTTLQNRCERKHLLCPLGPLLM